MKILIIHNKYKFAGGEDNVFHSESTLLQRYGHRVENLVFSNTTINTFIDRILSGLRIIYNPISAQVLQKKIDEFSPDVIHVHNFIPLASPSILFVAKDNGIPVVMTLHNYRLICPSATLFFQGRIYEKSLKRVFPFDAVWRGVYRNSRIQTAVIASMTLFHQVIGTWRTKVNAYILLTRFAKQKLIDSSRSIPEDLMIVKSNSVPDYGPGNSPRINFFLFVGRLVEEKGIATLMKAAINSRANIVIIGEGPLADVVSDAARQYSNIRYVGSQDKDSVIDCMKLCSALIFPSIWYEGFPMTILEAFSTGTPVIASNLGSMAEIIQHGYNGLLFEPGNEHDLASKMTDIQNRLVDLKELSSNARLTYVRRYTSDRNYNRLMSIYYSVIKPGSLPRNQQALQHTEIN
jgi:glycosyltransferase involved in cell wall biosynthesis